MSGGRQPAREVLWTLGAVQTPEIGDFQPGQLYDSYDFIRSREERKKGVVAAVGVEATLAVRPLSQAHRIGIQTQKLLPKGPAFGGALGEG